MTLEEKMKHVADFINLWKELEKNQAMVGKKVMLQRSIICVVLLLKRHMARQSYTPCLLMDR